MRQYRSGRVGLIPSQALGVENIHLIVHPKNRLKPAKDNDFIFVRGDVTSEPKLWVRNAEKSLRQVM